MESPTIAHNTTQTVMPATLTPPLDATTPPRMAAVSPGKTNPSITEASAATRTPTRRYASHPWRERSGWRSLLITARGLRRVVVRRNGAVDRRRRLSVDGAQRRLARVELAPAVLDPIHVLAAPHEVGQDVRLTLRAGEHPAVTDRHPDHGGAGDGGELERRVSGRDAIETSPLVEDRNLLGRQVAHLAPLVDAHEHAADRQCLGHGAEDRKS